MQGILNFFAKLIPFALLLLLITKLIFIGKLLSLEQKIKFIMKVCILGDNLTSLALAKALVKKEIFVDLFYEKKNTKIDITRTIGISKSNNRNAVFLRHARK